MTPELCADNQQNKTLGGMDIRQVSIVTKRDWKRIQDQLNRRQIEQERIQKINDENEQRRLNS